MIDEPLILKTNTELDLTCARTLPFGDLLIDETNHDQRLRFSNDRTLRSRVSDYNAKRIGIVSYRRHLSSLESRGPSHALAARPCCGNTSVEKIMVQQKCGLIGFYAGT